MKIIKSSRHSKITGDFAERLVLYWLSKYGFECAFVDHVGLDIIARNPHTEEVMGISVKSRSRATGTEGTCLSFQKDNLTKLEKACHDFNCTPYFALVVDEADSINGFILSKKHLLNIYPPGKTIAWKMTPETISKYAADPEIKKFKFITETTRWW
ncbi:MAG: hypothetical protein ACYC4Q_09090 [Victivallaceae bacterium]